MNTVNFAAPTDYTIEAEQIARQRKMAEALQSQSLQPIGDTQMVGGWAVPNSPMQGLAKMFQAYSGRKGMETADEKQKALADKVRGQGAIDVQAFMAALNGRPASSETIMDETANGGEGQQAQINAPAVDADRTKALAIAMNSQNPMVQGAGSAMLTQQLKANDPYSLREGEKRFGPGGQVIASNEKGPEAKVLSPGQTVVNIPRAGGPATPSFTAPQQQTEALRTLTGALEAAGIDPKSPEAQALFKQFATTKSTHQQPNMQNVTVNTEKQLLGNIAEGVGKDVATATSNAKSAIGTLNTVGQIREALDSGKVIAGPGSTARVFLGQLGQVLGISGKDATETLTKTRSAIQGLAQLELDGAQQMKGQGQITEAERGIIRRAASGDIDSLTGPEMRTLMDTLDRTARYKIKVNAANVAKVRANPQSASLADFMNVDEPPAYTPNRRASDAPEGVDAKLWGVMTPQERALWKK